MVVTEQHRRDRRQVVESHGRLPNSPRSDHVQRTCALRIHRIGQDVSGRRLNQKRGVTDERDDGGGAVQCRRTSGRHVDTRRPRCSRLAQHPRDRREWLPSLASGIEESPSIKVIALSSGDDPQARSTRPRSFVEHAPALRSHCPDIVIPRGGVTEDVVSGPQDVSSPAAELKKSWPPFARNDSTF